MLFSKKPKPSAAIAAQNIRYEIAWNIPRQKFLNPETPGDQTAPWWVEDTKYRTDPAAAPRYAELEKIVSQYEGSIALYAVTYTEGDEVLVERLVRSSGPAKAPLRKDVLPTPKGLRDALEELEAIVRKRAAAKPEASPARKTASTTVARKKKTANSADYVLKGLIAANILLFSGIGCAVTMPYFTSKPVAAPPVPVSEAIYFSRIVVPVDGTSKCEIRSFDNRTGRTVYAGTQPCWQARGEKENR